VQSSVSLLDTIVCVCVHVPVPVNSLVSLLPRGQRLPNGFVHAYMDSARNLKLGDNSGGGEGPRLRGQ